MKFASTLIKITFTFLVVSTSLVAQDYKDCSNPLVLCGDSPFVVEAAPGIGLSDQIDDTCLTVENQSVWIELNINVGGELIFVITPNEDILQDLDFAVFKLQDDDCDNKELVRCMASGETAGQDSEICLGATGLAFGETDTEEDPGCVPNSNNFLAPLAVQEGEKYMLLINEFSQTGDTYELAFGGSAGIDCISSSLESAPEQEAILQVLPSPSTGVFYIDFNSSIDDASLFVFDAQGKCVFSKEILSSQSETLTMLDQPDGIYYLVLEHNNEVARQRIILLK